MKLIESMNRSFAFRGGSRTDRRFAANPAQHVPGDDAEYGLVLFVYLVMIVRLLQSARRGSGPSLRMAARRRL